jgi:DNA-binding transcriptional LysR family regulator
LSISNETIRVIRTIAKHNNLSSAAQELNRVPSALSYTVRKLEQMLGVRLFSRHGRSIMLTPAGQYFIDHGKSILDEFDALKRNTLLVHEGIERELSVAVNNLAPQSAVVEFAAAFAQAFPATRLNLAIEVYNGCWEALYEGRADLVIAAPHAVPDSDGILSKIIGNVDWDFVVGNGHPLARVTTAMKNSELRQYAAVCIKDTAVNWVPQQAWLLDGQKPLFVPDYAMAMELIARNVGIGYLPHHLCQSRLDSGRLIKKPMQEHKHPTRLFIAHRDQGIGRARQWCIEYLGRPEIKAHFCGKMA